MGNTNTGGSLSQRLEHASKTGVLSLKELKLEQVPASVHSLKQSLRTLDISFNRISHFPEELGHFNNLRTLSFNNNCLRQIPLLGGLKKLEALHLQHNQLSSLAQSLGNLVSLKTLDVSHNSLTSFPPSLYTCPHLDYLNFSHNSLHSLPDDGIEKFTAVELNLSANSLSHLPPSLSMCKKLKVLRVEENCLELAGVPNELLAESKVSLLCVDGNLFQQKDLQQLPGYQQYTERYTATRRKVD